MNGYHKSECGKARAEVGSTRWVYNKFLRRQTKLRWVCGLCDVWCKDENGFKCHLESEGHLRKSELSRQRKGRDFKMSERDEAFAQDFVTYIAQNYLNQKVLLHEIYSEMYPKDAKKQLLIKDTCWGTLGVFVNALSKAGEIDAYREVKGWVVRIRQDRLIAAEAEADYREKWNKMQNAIQDDEDDDNPMPDPDMLGAWDDYTLLSEPPQPPPDEPSCLLARRGWKRPDVEVPQPRVDRMQASWAKQRDGVVAMRAKSPPRPDDGGAARAARLAWRTEEEEGQESEAAATERLDATPVSFSFAKRVKIEGVKKEVKQEVKIEGVKREVKQEVKQEVPPCKEEPPGEGEEDASWGKWTPGLVVKVLCEKALGGRAHMAKARTLDEDADDELEGEGVPLRLLGDESPKAFRVRPELLRTVLPKLGGRVRVLEGPFGEREGLLASLETEAFSCTVELADGERLPGLAYDAVCKVWPGSGLVVVD